MIPYVDEHASSFGVEPICRTLEIAPSSYYAARSRPPSARALADEQLKPKISEIHRENFAVYGAYKVWRVLRRSGENVGPPSYPSSCVSCFTCVPSASIE